MDKDFKTPDLYFAAYLQTAGVPMQGSNRTPEGRVYFVFDMTLANFEDLKNGWYSGSGKVSARSYSHAVKDLKALCHSR